jgi:hypothetical protein
MRLFASAVMTGGAVFSPIAGFKMVKARTKKKRGEKANNLFIDFSLMLDAIADSEPFGKKSILKFRNFYSKAAACVMIFAQEFFWFTPLNIKLPRMMIVVLVNKISNLFSGHSSKKPMHKIV